jgi:hypothetical protein
VASEELGRAYRVPPPSPDALVQWPDAFGTRFVVCVDTEEEFDWAAPFSRDAHATRSVQALPEAHARFADRGVPLTYLADYPIVADPAAVEILRRLIEDGRSAIGAQLHAWVNPPFDEPLSAVNSYVGNLPATLEATKLEVLTDAITAAFGTPPLIHRSGRYGIGPASFDLLAAHGYRIDISVRAGYDYSSDGGPDFSPIGNAAFRAGPAHALIELPFTTVFLGMGRSSGAALHRGLGRLPKGRGIAARLGILSRVSLTPEAMPIDEALEAVRLVVGEGLRLLQFAFHSPSVVPGNTPYVRDAADLAAFWRWWDTMLNELERLGVYPASLQEVIAAAAC